MNLLLFLAPLLAAATLAGCTEDPGGTTFSTFVTTFSTMTSPTTNVTSFETWPSGDAPTTGETTGEGEDDTLGASETTAPPAADGTTGTTGGTTEALTTDGSTTGETGVDPTTGAQDGPLVDPPLGCAVIVEALGRGDATERFAVIDMSACPRVAVTELQFETFGPDGTFSKVVIPHRGCGTYGGESSPASAAPDGVVMEIAGGDEATAWRFMLWVDGLLSDELRLPAVLMNQAWPDEPLAPLTPVRRREDFSWVVIPEHVGGCDLMPVF